MLLVGLEPGRDMSRDCCKLIILPIEAGYKGYKGIRCKRVLALTLWAKGPVLYDFISLGLPRP